MPGFVIPVHSHAAHMPHAIAVAPRRGPSHRSGYLEQARKQILAVDDEPEALDLLRALLGAEGFEVAQATSAAQAIAAIESEKPDLLIVDYMMPGMSGIELCEYLRRAPETRHIPIVMYSAHQIPHSYADRNLYDRSFTKPADHEDLLAAIFDLVRVPRS